MHKLVELREILLQELEDYGTHEQLDISELDVIDKLAHAIKNIDKVINADCDDYDYYDRGTYSKRGRMSGIKRHEEDRSRNEVVRSSRYE